MVHQTASAAGGLSGVLDVGIGITDTSRLWIGTVHHNLISIGELQIPFDSDHVLLTQSSVGQHRPWRKITTVFKNGVRGEGGACSQQQRQSRYDN